MANEIGYAYVTIMPSMSEFSRALSKAIKEADAFKDLSKAAKEAGEKAGEQMSESMAKGAKKAKETVSKTVKEAGGDAGKEAGEKIANQLVQQFNQTLKRHKEKQKQQVMDNLAEALDNPDIRRKVREAGINISKDLVTDADFKNFEKVVNKAIKEVEQAAKENEIGENIFQGIFSARAMAKLKRELIQAVDAAVDNDEIYRRASEAGLIVGNELVEGFDNSDLKKLKDIISDVSEDAAIGAGQRFGEGFTDTFRQVFHSRQQQIIKSEMQQISDELLNNPELMRRAELEGILPAHGVSQEDKERLKEIIAEYKKELEAAGREAGVLFSQRFNEVYSDIDKKLFARRLEDAITTLIQNPEIKQAAEDAGLIIGNSLVEGVSLDDLEDTITKATEEAARVAAEEAAKTFSEEYTEKFREIGERLISSRMTEILTAIQQDPSMRQAAENAGLMIGDEIVEGVQFEDFDKMFIEETERAAREAAEASAKTFSEEYSEKFKEIGARLLERRMTEILTAIHQDPSMRQAAQQAGLIIGDEIVEGVEFEDFNKMFIEETERAAREAGEKAGKTLGERFSEKFKQVGEQLIEKQMSEIITAMYQSPSVKSALEHAGLIIGDELADGVELDDLSKVVTAELDRLAKEAGEKAGKSLGERLSETFGKRSEQLLDDEMRHISDTILNNDEVKERIKQLGIEITRELTDEEYRIIKGVVDDFDEKLKEPAKDAGKKVGDAFGEALNAAIQRRMQQKVQLEVDDYLERSDAEASFSHAVVTSGVDFAKLSTSDIEKMRTNFESTGNIAGEAVSKGMFDSLINAFKSGSSSGGLSGGMSAVKSAFTEGVTTELGGGAAAAAAGIGIGIAVVIGKKLLDAIKEFATNAKQLFDQVIQTIYDTMRRGAELLVRVFYEAYRKIAELLVTVLRPAFEASFKTLGLNIITEGFNGNVLSNIKNSLGSFFTDLGGGIIENLKGGVENVIGNGIVEPVKNTLTTLTDAFTSFASTLMSNAWSAISNNVSGAVERYDTLENFPRIMESLGVESESSTYNVQRLSDAIDGLPTKLDDIVTFTEKIIPSFEMDLNKATDAAIAFNNALVSDGKTATQQKNAMEQWSQMLANNKVDMLSWRSVNEAMPTSMNTLAKYFGASNSLELYNMLPGSKGAQDAGGPSVTLEQLNDALMKLNEEGLGGFVSYAEKAKTATFGIGTAITNLNTRIQKALAEGMAYVGQKEISGVINNFSSKLVPRAKDFVAFLDRIGIKSFVTSITDTLSTGIDRVYEALLPMRDELEPTLRDGLATTLEFVESAVDALSDGLVGLVSTMNRFSNNARRAFGTLKVQLRPFMSGVINTGLRTLGSLIEGVSQSIGQVATAADRLLDRINTKMGPVNDKFQNFITNLTSIAVQTIATMINAVADSVDGLTDAFGSLFDETEANMPVLSESLQPLVGDGIILVMSTVQSVIQGTANAIGSLTATLADLFGKLDANFGPLNEKLQPFIEGTVEGAFESLGSIIQGISNTVGGLAESLSNMLDTLNEKLGPVKEALQPILEASGEAIVGVLQSITDGISGSLEGIDGEAVKETAQNFTEGFRDLTSSVFPLITDGIKMISNVFGNAMSHLSDKAPGFLDNIIRIIDEVHEKLPDIQNVLTDIVNAFIDFRLDSIEAAIDMWSRIITAAGPELPNIINAISTITSTLADFVGDIAPTVIPFLNDLLTTVADTFKTIEPFLVVIVNSLAPIITTIVEQMADVIKQVAPALASILQLTNSEGVPLLQSIVQNIGEIVSKIISTLLPHMPKILEMFDTIISALVPAIDRILDAIEPHIDDIIETIKNGATRFIEAIAKSFEWLDEHWDEVQETVNDLIAFAADHMENMFKNALTLINDTKDLLIAITNFKDSVFTPMMDALSPIFDGLKGFGNMINIINGKEMKVDTENIKVDPIDVSVKFLTPGNLDNIWWLLQNLFGNMHPMAAGGIVNGPTSALIGEAGTPEAVVPLSAEGIAKFTSGLSDKYTGNGDTRVDVHIDTFVNNDTNYDVNSLCDEIGRTSIRKLREQGVAA